MAALLLLTVLLTVGLCEPYRILVAFPLPTKSHSILGDGIARLLAQAGHEVTYITPYPVEKPHPNIRQVDVSGNVKLTGDILSLKTIMEDKTEPLQLSTMKKLITICGDMTISQPAVQRLVNDHDQVFDVIVAEWAGTEILAGLSAVFNCPYIWSFSVDPNYSVLELIDEASNPAYNSAVLSKAVPPFSFVERAFELFLQISGFFFKRFYLLPAEVKSYHEIYEPILAKRGRMLPSFDEIRYNASLILGNSYPPLGQPTRLPQNYASIGGYHVNPEIKPLPENLQKILDSAKYGVIYFSMGSNLKSKELPDAVKRNLVKMFGKLKYTVLWKFEENLPDLPKNLYIIQWAPQQSILAHKNCVLFITHGGMLSTIETMYFGKPIIGIPVFGDQFINVERSVKKGFAKKVDLSYTMVDDLEVAISEMLGNPKYAARIKELSTIFHDRPVSPGKELVHWVEHVARTRGAPHLRSPALGLPFYQKMYLDLLAFVLIVILIVKKLVNKCFSALRVNKDKKNN